jgi:outer membrane immunogenic protein
MKRILLTAAFSAVLFSSAHAADAIVEQAPELPVAAYNWSGAYIGVFGGITTGDYGYEAAAAGGPAASFDVSGSGALGGVQLGYDYQTGPWVFGAVADIAFTNHEASLSGSIPGVGNASAESELKYLGTVRARAGYAFDRALFYGHGGFAYGKTEQDVVLDGVSVFSGDKSRTGFVVGAGVEYAITDRISFQTEYSYVDLGKDDIFNQGGLTVREDVSFHAIKAAVNFRF